MTCSSSATAARRGSRPASPSRTDSTACVIAAGSASAGLSESKRSVMTPSTPQSPSARASSGVETGQVMTSSAPPSQVGDRRRVEQIPVDRHAREPPSGEATPQRPQLAAAADGVHEPNAGQVAKRLEQRPVARADGDARRLSAGDCLRDAAREADVTALEVEHQLGARRRGGQQRLEPQARLPSGRQPPAVPQHRERAQRLEVPDLDAAAPQVQISLDEPRRQRLGASQDAQVVAGAVGHDERCGHPDRV